METKINFRPATNRILIERRSVKDKSNFTAGGIIIPEFLKQSDSWGTIVAVGNLQKDVSIGQKVLFDEYKGVELELEGREFLLLEYKDCLAVW